MSTVNPISSSIIDLLSTAPVTNNTLSALTKGDQEAAESFADILSAAWNNAAVTDTLDKASTVELLTGQTDDLSGLMADVQKAEIALNLTLQLRNKVLDAYQEIMNMQV